MEYAQFESSRLFDRKSGRRIARFDALKRTPIYLRSTLEH